MQLLDVILKFSTQIITNVVYFISLYYLCLSFFGIIRFRDKKNYEPQKSFALIVAAHNEEAVVGDIALNLNDLDYPKELYDVFVIADNCTDKTAEIARKNGATVFERFNTEKRGKGYALEWMFEKIFAMDKSYDSVVIFDADNLASKNFLKVMNNKLCEGNKVVQGFLDSKNPNDTWITGSYSIAFWTSNRMFQLSRSNIGLSNQLGGTGFCIDTEILKEIGWGATCLTEDLEFTCKLVLNGLKVGWAHEAKIYDEKPLKLQQSWNQRKRWMQGFTDVSTRYFFKLMKRFLTKLDFRAFDCALYTIQPFVIVVISTSMFITSVNYVFHLFNILIDINAYIHTLDPAKISIGVTLLAIMQFVYTPFLLLLDKKLNKRMFFYYVIYPVYALTWLPITIQGILHKNNKEWSHTKHTRSISIDELENVN